MAERKGRRASERAQAVRTAQIEESFQALMGPIRETYRQSVAQAETDYKAAIVPLAGVQATARRPIQTAYQAAERRANAALKRAVAKAQGIYDAAVAEVKLKRDEAIEALGDEPGVRESEEALETYRASLSAAGAAYFAAEKWAWSAAEAALDEADEKDG